MSTPVTPPPGEQADRTLLLGQLALKVQEIDRRLGEIQGQWFALHQGLLPAHRALPPPQAPAHQRYSPRLVPAITRQKEQMVLLEKGLALLEESYHELTRLTAEERAIRQQLLALTPEPPPPPAAHPEPPGDA